MYINKKIPNELHTQLETDSKYNVYLTRQLEDIKAYKKETKIKIPTDFNFNQIKGLSNETKDILNNVRPTTFSQVSKLPGLTPAATLLLLRHLKKLNLSKVVNEN